MASEREIDTDSLGERIAALPGFAAVRAAAGRAGADAYLVGGAIRDALLGRSVGNLDLVVDTDAAGLIEALGAPARVYDRFETATVDLPSGPVDVARARSETYAHPGALPEVRPATVTEDLGRRDFTVNALAVPLADPAEVVDPHGGLDDLRAGRLRVLHDRSFVDDPTRALRGARYAARLGLEVEPDTLRLLRATDLGTVSRDRVGAELRRLAAEDDPGAGFALLDEWGLVALADGAAALIGSVREVLDGPAWANVVDRRDAVLAAARGPGPEVRSLVGARPASPSEAVDAVRGTTAVDLALARAAGATWLDDYIELWRDVRLQISGDDLIAAGVDEGPAIGRGLTAALRAKLDGETAGREDELRIAVEAAGS